MIRIVPDPDPDFYVSRIPGSKRHRIRIRNTAQNWQFKSATNGNRSYPKLSTDQEVCGRTSKTRRRKVWPSTSCSTME